MNDCTTWRKHLVEQLRKVLEDTAFMLVEDPEAPLPTPSPAIEACLSFSGKYQGHCYLVVAESDAQALAVEILGTSQPVSQASDVCDNAVGELLNILTAWVLDDWWGEQTAHDLGLPTTRRVPIEQTILWSVPDDGRVVITTDSGGTFISGIVLEG